MTEKVIGASRLVKNYPDVPAVRDVSFAVHRGEIFALLGPNGAGKTTVVEMLQFAKEPTRGFVYVLDSEAIYHDTKSYSGIREKIGVLPQHFSAFDLLTVRENLDYFSRMYTRRAGSEPADIDRLIEELGLIEKRDALFRDLSGGLRQRVGIAIALVNDPEVLFLDEPTTGLDPRARRDVWDMIRGLKARGKTVFLTTHYMDEAYHLADRVCIMSRGRIVAEGTPDDLINRYGGGNTLVLRDCAPGAIVRLAGAIPGCEISGSDVTVKLPEGDGMATLAKAMSLVAEGGLSCRELYVKKATLEEVFLNLAGERLADEQP